MSIKIKSCEIMQYFNHYDTCDVNIICNRINSLNQLKTYCFIIHDADVNVDSTLKEKHFHIVLTFNNATTIEAVARKMKVEPNFVNKIKTTVELAQAYLIHKNDPSKHQYDASTVMANFDYVNFIERNGSNKLPSYREIIAQQIDDGIIRQYNIHDYVNIDDFARNHVYYEQCFKYRMRKIRGLDRNMECIFISGASGTGKTTFAKIISANKNYSSFISSSGKNPLDDYEGQDCIILDDIRPSTWALNDLLKITDPYTDSMVGARYYNKYIGECKLIIATSVVSLDKFYQQVSKEDNEPIKQLFRRFSTLFYLTADKGFAVNYDISNNTFVTRGEFVNPVALMFNKDVIKKTTEQFFKTYNLTPIENADPKDQMHIINDNDELPF